MRALLLAGHGHRPLPRRFDLADNTYFNNSFNVNGTMAKAAPGQYLTNAIGNASLSWLEGVVGSGQPFFAYIAPHGACVRGGGGGAHAAL